jgi:hypothetical protein
LKNAGFFAIHLHLSAIFADRDFLKIQASDASSVQMVLRIHKKSVKSFGTSGRLSP